MNDRVTRNKIADFIAALESEGGTAGNESLRRALEWDKDFYWKVQSRLISEGRIEAGRGRGGSVILTDVESDDTDNEEIDSETTRERKLYPPLKKTLIEWVSRFGLSDHVFISDTHTAGRRHTGGQYSRPDLTVVGVVPFEFVAPRLEVITIEVKTADSVSVQSVTEAACHRDASHRAYVLFPVSVSKFENEVRESRRIVSLAASFGVGIILAEKLDDTGKWEERLEPIRHDPDPSKLNSFLGTIREEENRKLMKKWRSDAAKLYITDR